VPRKQIPIDTDALEKLAMLHCTGPEVAAFFECNQSTISRRLAKEPLKSVWERGWAKGNISIRRQQMQRAEAGDKTMLIWLGKQWLGQKDSPLADDERHDELRRFLDIMEGRTK